MTYEEFKRQYPIPLNPQQEEAVRLTEGPVLLLAVRGGDRVLRPAEGHGAIRAAG